MTYNEIMRFENIGKRYVTKIGHKFVVVEVIETGYGFKTLALQIVIGQEFDLNFEEIGVSDTE